MKGPIQSVEVSFLVHATEDISKVEKRVTEALRIRSAPAVEDLEGHFGNDIQRAAYRLFADEAAGAFGALVKGLPEETRQELVGEIDDHIDEHQALYVRLDKQGVMEGRLVLGSEDSVRVKVKPRLYALKSGARQFYLEALTRRG